MNIKLDIPEKFFEGEERCGYYVSPEMKKVWAVELDLIAEFARVCEKHNLKWWIDSGTLLGAVRHKGFIPWDDDVDVWMMSKDYEYLLKIADDEFSRPYLMNSIYSSDTAINHLPFAKLYNEDTTMLGNRELDMLKHGIEPEAHKGIFIDIFPIYSLPDDDREIVKLYEKLHSLVEPAATKCYGRLMNWTDCYTPARSLWKRPIKAILHYLLCPVNPFLGGLKENLRKKRDRYCQEFTTLLRHINYPNSHKVARLGSLAAFQDKFIPRKILDRSDFNDTVYLPFEMMTLPAPAGYVNILDRFYGNWHEYFIKARHGDFYDAERPYTYYTQKSKQNITTA